MGIFNWGGNQFGYQQVMDRWIETRNGDARFWREAFDRMIAERAEQQVKTEHLVELFQDAETYSDPLEDEALEAFREQHPHALGEDVPPATGKLGAAIQAEMAAQTAEFNQKIWENVAQREIQLAHNDPETVKYIQDELRAATQLSNDLREDADQQWASFNLEDADVAYRGAFEDELRSIQRERAEALALANNQPGVPPVPFQEPEGAAYNAELPAQQVGEARQDPAQAREFTAPAADGSPPDYSDPSFSNEERLASLKDRFPGFNEEDLKRFQEPEKYKELWLAADNRDRHHAAEDARAAESAAAETAPAQQPVDWRAEGFADLEQRRQAVEERFGESSAEFKDLAAADHGDFARVMERQDELDERRAAEAPKEEDGDAPDVIEPIRRPEDDDDAPSI